MNRYYYLVRKFGNNDTLKNRDNEKQTTVSHFIRSPRPYGGRF